MKLILKDININFNVCEMPIFMQSKDKKYEGFANGDILYVNRLYYDILYIEAFGADAWVEFAKKRAMKTITNYINENYI